MLLPSAVHNSVVANALTATDATAQHKRNELKTIKAIKCCMHCTFCSIFNSLTPFIRSKIMQNRFENSLDGLVTPTWFDGEQKRLILHIFYATIYPIRLLTILSTCIV